MSKRKATESADATVVGVITSRDSIPNPPCRDKWGRTHCRTAQSQPQAVEIQITTYYWSDAVRNELRTGVSLFHKKYGELNQACIYFYD